MDEISSLRERIDTVYGSGTWDRAIGRLPQKRRPHVEGCIAEAGRLAAHWGGDVSRSMFAALLHDVTKAEGPEGQLNLCRKYGIIPEITDVVAFGPLHAITGAEVARSEFGADPDIVSAIRWHTTGKADMTLLEKIVYLADYIEPTRDFDGVESVRAVAYRNLDLAMLTALKNTICEISIALKPIAKASVEAYNHYLMRKPQ